MPERVVETKKQEQLSDDTVELEPPTATDDPEDTPTASGDNPEEPPSASGGDLKESPTASGGELKESPTASGGELKESPSASGGDVKEPPSASGGDVKEPPTASGGDVKEPPSASGGDVKEPSTASGGDQKESLSLSFDESELDYSYLSTLMKDVGSFQLCESLERTDLDKKGSNGDTNIPKDTSSSGLLHEPTPTIVSDSSSESEVEVESDDDEEMLEIKKQISRTDRLFRKAQDAKAVCTLMEEGDPLATEVLDDDFIVACNNLIFTINSHIKDVSALAERIRTPTLEELDPTLEELDPGTLNPDPSRRDPDPRMEERATQIPWMNLNKLINLIKQLAATGGVTVTPEEVQDTINRNIVQANFKNYLDGRKAMDKRIADIVSDLKMNWEQAEEFLDHLREFEESIIVGDVSAAKTVEGLKRLYAELSQMASDCDRYLTMGLLHSLQVNSKLYEYVTENSLLLAERNSFLKSRMNLFGPIN